MRKPNFSKLILTHSLPFVSAGVFPVLLLVWSPYQLSGKSFLIFYAVVAIFALMVTWILQRLLISDGNSRWERFRVRGELPSNHFAYLAGGRQQVMKSALYELIAGGYAKSFRQQLQLAPKGNGDCDSFKLTKVATKILKKLQIDSSIDYAAIKSTVRLPVASIRADLVRAGLIESQTKRYVLAWVSGLIITGVLAVGVLRLIQASGTGRPVGFLVLEMVAVLILAVPLVLTVPWRTRTGKKVIAEEKARYKSFKGKIIKDDSSPKDIGLIVSLFGPIVLIGTRYSSIRKEVEHVLANPISTSGGGDGGSVGGDGGGGGCEGGCGGGCGGCGG